MAETRPASRTSVKGNRPTGPRPVEVTVVSLLFIAGSVTGVVLLVVFELRGTRFGLLENLGDLVLVESQSLAATFYGVPRIVGGQAVKN